MSAQITVDQDHLKAKDSQLILVITGTPEYINDRLLSVMNDINNDIHSGNSKPAQGTSLASGGNLCQVITPIWRGQKY